VTTTGLRVELSLQKAVSQKRGKIVMNMSMEAEGNGEATAN
jgi:hypothetical protein